MDQNVDVDHIAINKISQKLASNDVQLRNYTLKKLRRWLERSATSNDGLICEINLLRLWKGLHYCMWMADKPLFQEELAERLSALVGAFKRQEEALLFVSSFLKIEAQEWHLLDFFRLDKFMMLLRKVIIQSLKLLQTNNWDSSLIQKFVTIVDDALKIDSAPGFVTHLLNVIKDELKQLLQGQFVQEDERIQQFSQLFANRNRKLVDVQLNKKKKKLISAAECKATMKEALTKQDIEEAATRMVQFEYETVLNKNRGKKNRERKRKRETDEDSDAQPDENGGSQEESMAVEEDDDLDDGDSDDDDLDDDDLSEDESSLDSLSDIEPTPKKPKTKLNSQSKGKQGKASEKKQYKQGKASEKKRYKQGKASEKKQFSKKKLPKQVKGRTSEKKKPNKKAGKRPHASDFF